MAEACCSHQYDSVNDTIKNGTVKCDEESLPQHELATVPCAKHTSSKKTEKEVITKNMGENSPDSINVSALERKEDIKLKKEEKKENMSSGKKKLYSWLNKQMKIEMTDGRILVGIFLCTDRDANIILGSCTEFLNPEVCGFTDEPRMLGLVMVPGRHIVSIHHDASDLPSEEKEVNSKVNI